MEVVWRALSYKSSAAEARAARSNYKRFAERQLKENLKPILTIF
jgi:energy-coupling factor transporter transmembrane protein EcfT